MQQVLCIFFAVIALAYASVVGVAHLAGSQIDPTIVGQVYFIYIPSNNTVTVWASISGITVGADLAGGHGLHVHTYGDLYDYAAGSTAGSHYVGQGATSHGCEGSSTRHEGDMGNWQVSSGSISMAKNVDLLQVAGQFSIIGRAVVLHSQTDDCATVPSSGSRLALGVIGIANPDFYPQYVINVLSSESSAVKPNDALAGDTTITKASAVIFSTSLSTGINGTIVFEYDTTSMAVTVTAALTGLDSSKAYGFHIHNFGDFYANGISNGTLAGGHFNTSSDPHGGPLNSTRHAGDLGNICSYSASLAYYQWVMTDMKFSIGAGATFSNSILGRDIVVHSVYDTMLPSTQFGSRIAIGVIGAMDSAFNAAQRIQIPSSLVVSSPVCAAFAPTPAPTTAPTTAPTSAPTSAPTTAPTSAPTSSPTTAPTAAPSSASQCVVTLFFFAAVLAALF